MASPVLYRTTDCRTESDTEKPYLHDITVLVLDALRIVVVTDWNNKCVKSFLTDNSQSCHDKLILDNGPCGITQLKENQVMVAVPASRQIIKIEVTPDLVLLSTITTSGQYYSLAVLGPTSLAAGGVSPSCVDILNMDGQVIKSVSTHNGVELFKFPWYMCINNKNNLLVSDFGKKSVICLTSEGDVVWIYAPCQDKGIRNHMGITSTNGRNILLADCNFHTIVQLTETGQHLRDVINDQDGLSFPCGMYMDTQGTLFVTEREQIKEFLFP